MRARLSLRPCRDASVATLALLAAVWIGSRGGRDLDPALLGYAGATVVAAFGVTWRASAFWRRPASAHYGRTLLGALAAPSRWPALFRSAGADLGAQTFIARRSRLRWVAHLLLSLGTLASFAITVPLVLGWLHFEAEGQSHYRPMLFGMAAGPALAIDGPLAWLTFHALLLAGIAVAGGAAYFLAVRLRPRARAAASERRHVAPLLLLLVVALSGLALPATRMHPTLFAIASGGHELAVIVLLVALPFSKLGHVLIRPLQLGARVQNAAAAARLACVRCGDTLAPAAQLAAVEALLAARGARFAGHQQHCPVCRRRQVAAAQARLLGAPFHPDLVATRRPDLGKVA